MLTELYIRDFAIIDELRLEIPHGFTVLTGETGAGKSIILDAVSLVLGGRADTSMVRAGKEFAFIEANFQLTPDQIQQFQPLFEQEGLENDPPHQLLIARELRSNGRSIARINGRSVSLNFLYQISEPLVDIHGQGEHLSLLKPKAHLPLLDAFGGLVDQRDQFSEQFEKLRRVQRELAALKRDERLISQRLDMLEYQVKEIDAADLKVGEEEELREERNRLANAEQLARYATEISVHLAGMGDEDSLSVVDLLGQAERSLSRLAGLDDSQAVHLENLQGLTFQFAELAAHMQKYLNNLEFNPLRLNEVEERLELIASLRRKYGDSITEVLAAKERAISELDQISHSEERIAELTVEEERLLRIIGHLGEELSKNRQAAAQDLSTAVEKQLNDLQMAGARFEVLFSRKEDANGAFVGEERVSFDQSGLDIGEFVISANPGEPLKPLAKVASGGETARLMLALKTALAEVDSTPTLIFDEIDQGIGGRVGATVGRKLWGLTAVGRHQVIVVTHLPQLAGYGDVHYQVRKHVINDRTITAVNNLDVSGRINELADMLGTRGDSAVGGAEAILRQVQATKAEIL